jgi:hypothetical protein
VMFQSICSRPAAVAMLLSRANASGGGDGSGKDEATCTQFDCLALLAHLLNEQVVVRMQTAAKAGTVG